MTMDHVAVRTVRRERVITFLWRWLAILSLIAFWSYVSWSCGAEAFGSPLDCEAIHDPDARHMCRAVTKHDPTECELIRGPELRVECRARVVLSERVVQLPEPRACAVPRVSSRLGREHVGSEREKEHGMARL
jgi:hypothetical protein